MNPEPSAPAPEPHPPETPAAKGPGTLPTSVLVLGFICVVLLGVLVALTLKGKPGEDSDDTANSALKEKQGRLQALEDDQNEQRVKLGLSPLYTGDTRESAEKVAERITKDAATLVALSKGVKELIADKDAERAQVAKELSEALQFQAVLRDQIASLQKDKDKALIESSTATMARSELEKANATVAALRRELERLRGESSPDLQGQLAAATKDREALLAKIRQLEAKLSEGSLFASSETQLLQEAQTLFRSLRELEGEDDSNIGTAYSQFGAKLGASVMDKKIAFPTGSYEITPEDSDRISSFITEAPDNAFIFVVGYASETGNVDANRVLSSDRATAVAKVINNVKKPTQRVQAAYLGQTDRFGSRNPESNQICEVWQIIPKSE